MVWGTDQHILSPVDLEQFTIDKSTLLHSIVVTPLS